MRLAELERWLARQGWQQEDNRTGSGRAWRHPAYRGRLTYHAPHGRDGRELRPDVVDGILRDLEAMVPIDDDETTEREAS